MHRDSSTPVVVVRARAIRAGSASNQKCGGVGFDSPGRVTPRGMAMPRAGKPTLSPPKSNPLSVRRPNRVSWYSPQRSATTTSPTVNSGSAPPPTPLTTMRLIGKWSMASWVVMAALTIDTPDRNSTTGLPSSRPVTNTVPRIVISWRSVVAAFSAASSGAKAEITAVRDSSAWARPAADRARQANRTGIMRMERAGLRCGGSRAT